MTSMASVLDRGLERRIGEQLGDIYVEQKKGGWGRGLTRVCCSWCQGHC